MKIVGDNIISSLGFTTDTNFLSVCEGKSGLELRVSSWGEPFVASFIDRNRLHAEFEENCGLFCCSDLEQAMILSILYATEGLKIDLSSDKTLFIFSTTKGNIEYLERYESFGKNEDSSVFLWATAQKVISYFKNPNAALVVSVACVSGGMALLTAQRMLRHGDYEHVIVVGGDLLSKFVVSGFQSFKALSDEVCRPFDKSHSGLNLGEAVASVVCTNSVFADTPVRGEMLCGFSCNDAFHISAPAMDARGSIRVLEQILQHVTKEEIAFINAHGTATRYNDEMELRALVSTGLNKIPVNSLKSFLGHTLGAAGVVESIISLCALRSGIVLGNPGLKERMSLLIDGQDIGLDVSRMNRKTDKSFFIKMLSGFGGVNTALLFKK